MTDPGAFLVTETLRNGLVVTIRALRPEDREKIGQAVRQLDRNSIYYRLFSHRTVLTEAGLDRIMRFDPATEVVLVVTTGGGAEETVIGSGSYVVGNPEQVPRTAEVAFMVAEKYHGLGIAGRLLRHLSDIGRVQGITALDAEVLADNAAMLAVFARSGLPMQKRRESGVVHITLSL